jgi:DNA-binding response OmpR family regulator
MSKRRVLVIDDEPRILDIVKYFLEQGGYEVGAFSNPPEGLAAARRAPFDVAVLDIVLEGTSGYDVAFELKKIKNSERVPVLFMSSKVEMAKLFLESYDGRAEFILKPFKKADLLDKIALLDGGGGRDAHKTAPPSRNA